RIGLAVVAHVDGGGRALEDIELLRPLAEMGHALDRRGAGADDADDLVSELRQIPAAVAAGVAIVPTARMKRVALELVDAGNAGKLRPAQRSVRHGDELSGEPVAPARRDDPARRLLVPAKLRYQGLHQGVVVEVVRRRDAL